MISAPIRHPKPLRTKKGCVVCRARRKKCDERKPVCATCERLGFKCHFPDVDSMEDRRERGGRNSRWPSKPANSQIQASKSHNSIDNVVYYANMPSLERTISSDAIVYVIKTSYYGILSSAEIFLRSDRELQLSTHYFELFLPENILPEAYTECARMYLEDVSELRDVMLACSSIHQTNKCRTGSVVEALNYYTRALSSLQRRINAGDVNGTEDWLLVMTLLLHCFETWRCDIGPETANRSQHLLGAIQLLKLRCTNPAAKTRHDVFILVAESVLFHISTLLASSSSSVILDVDSGLWEWMEIILQKPAQDDASQHPVLGTPWELNKLVFEISKLSIHLPATEEQTLDRRRLSKQLATWENRSKKSSVGSRNPAEDNPYIYVGQLYVICARIILLWIEAAGDEFKALTLEEQVRSRVVKAIAIIRAMKSKSDELWNFLMRWPLLILGHTVETKSERELIQESMKRIWDRSACGDVKRSLDKMQGLWKGDNKRSIAVGTNRLLGGWSQRSSNDFRGKIWAG